MSFKDSILNFLGIKPKIIIVERTNHINNSIEKPISQIRNFPKQDHKTLLTRDEVRNIIDEKIKPKYVVEINDNMYYGVNLDSIYSFSEWFGLDEMEYSKNISGNESENELRDMFGDCNVFGHGLKGVVGIWDSSLAIAECLGYFNGSKTYHFSNLIINEDREILRLEPQTNKFEYINNDDKILGVRF